METIAETTMEVFGVPTARRNIFLDNDDDEEKITEQFMKLVKKSEELGSAIGTGHVKISLGSVRWIVFFATMLGEEAGLSVPAHFCCVSHNPVGVSWNAPHLNLLSVLPSNLT